MNASYLTRRGLTRFTIRLQFENQTYCRNEWSGLFGEKPSKEMVLAVLQLELKRARTGKYSTYKKENISHFTRLIKAMELWDETSQSILFAGVFIAEIKWVTTDFFYEVDED